MMEVWNLHVDKIPTLQDWQKLHCYDFYNLVLCINSSTPVHAFFHADLEHNAQTVC